ncbi:uncharacterized protein LOC119727491 isoform X2 [Patiria miniata]|uniref:Uncharacterized protein n=1 Tax=Patiria miniata TaxID=46514 RepID=A0A913ZUR9_PATMI|nr:uncharacterized protein LOC119727491 isoform X2 [Patiria miniata]
MLLLGQCSVRIDGSRNIYAESSYGNNSNIQDDMTIGYCIGLGFLGLLIISSILLLVGVVKDKRGFLLPYMVMLPLQILMQIIVCILIIYALATASHSQYEMPDLDRQMTAPMFITAFLISMLIAILGLTILNVFCFLCVVSQYTELRDGRGRLQNVNADKLSMMGYMPLQEQHQLQPMLHKPSQQQQQQQGDYLSKPYTDYPEKDQPPTYYPQEEV